MRAREIAETLVNGNITVARQEICYQGTTINIALTALDVVEELADMDTVDYSRYDNEWQQAIDKVRRCLNGGT